MLPYLRENPLFQPVPYHYRATTNQCWLAAIVWLVSSCTPARARRGPQHRLKLGEGGISLPVQLLHTHTWLGGFHLLCESPPGTAAPARDPDLAV